MEMFRSNVPVTCSAVVIGTHRQQYGSFVEQRRTVRIADNPPETYINKYIGLFATLGDYFPGRR
jgi:hypothetical protein